MRCASFTPTHGEVAGSRVARGDRGLAGAKREHGSSESSKSNRVHDEEFRPQRRFKVSGTMFEVDTKYELIKPIGHGAYGVVISALNTETGQKVAIKKITHAFYDLVDAKRILREIKLLRNFSHENIINILDILVPPSSEEFEDVYIVSDLMETDLHRIINSRQDLTLDHVQYFLYQVLRALKYMHSSNVLHRDLKPSNLLLNSNCDLKICDLGLARDIESGCRELTEYVVTRWYRAPEIMLACQEYSKAIDVWSVGCIFAELMLRRPFFPGDSYIDQLKIICDKLGKPKIDDLDFVTADKARRFIMNLEDTPPRCLRDQFPSTASDDALHLLSRMLEFNPGKRISVVDALRHPFIRNLHHQRQAAKDEPMANLEYCFRFEEEELSRHRLKELIWEEMRRYHPEQGPWRGKAPNNRQGSSPATVTPTTATFRQFSHLGAELRTSPGVAVPIPKFPSTQTPLGKCFSGDNSHGYAACAFKWSCGSEREALNAFSNEETGQSQMSLATNAESAASQTGSPHGAARLWPTSAESATSSPRAFSAHAVAHVPPSISVTSVVSSEGDRLIEETRASRRSTVHDVCTTQVTPASSTRTPPLGSEEHEKPLLGSVFYPRSGCLTPAVRARVTERACTINPPKVQPFDDAKGRPAGAETVNSSITQHPPSQPAPLPPPPPRANDVATSSGVKRQRSTPVVEERRKSASKKEEKPFTHAGSLEVVAPRRKESRSGKRSRAERGGSDVGKTRPATAERTSETLSQATIGRSSRSKASNASGKRKKGGSKN